MGLAGFEPATLTILSWIHVKAAAKFGFAWSWLIPQTILVCSTRQGDVISRALRTELDHRPLTFVGYYNMKHLYSLVDNITVYDKLAGWVKKSYQIMVCNY